MVQPPQPSLTHAIDNFFHLMVFAQRSRIDRHGLVLLRPQGRHTALLLKTCRIKQHQFLNVHPLLNPAPIDTASVNEAQLATLPYPSFTFEVWNKSLC